MYLSRMVTHQVQEPIEIADAMNYKHSDYSQPIPTPLFITRTSNTQYTANESNLMLGQFSGYSTEEIKVGSLIDGKYKVEDAFPAKDGYAYYLSTIGKETPYE